MDLKIQSTPNPNAQKFILDTVINDGEKLDFKSPAEATCFPMIMAIFQIANIKKISVFANTLTITKESVGDWELIEDEVSEVFSLHLSSHSSKMQVKEEVKERVFSSENEKRLHEIIDKEIRPHMQADGGDIEIIKFDESSNILYVQFTGACGSCPSALYGTLEGIKGILKAEYDSELEVLMI